MKKPRVKRGQGPRSLLTKSNYRRKALPHLHVDFEGHCAYCLDPSEFRHPTLSHVDHFNCRLKGRRRHQYKNLMLGCAACNIVKHDKPVINPLNADQRLLNCTEENEFIEHIEEAPDGDWRPLTEAGVYHIHSIALTEQCHKAKRVARLTMAQRVHSLLTTAIKYEGSNPAETHAQIMGTVSDILKTLEGFPPLVTKQGVMTVREWLASKGLDLNQLTP